MSIGMASAAVQDALYARLHGDATLLALVTGVYDEPPEGTAFPYVVIGNVQELPKNRMGGKVGRELIASVEAWSEARSMKEVQTILARVDVLLDNDISLAVTGYTVERLDLDGNSLERVPIIGGPLRHGENKYRIQVVES